jgi:hypothetical protein
VLHYSSDSVEGSIRIVRIIIDDRFIGEWVRTQGILAISQGTGQYRYSPPNFYIITSEFIMSYTFEMTDDQIDAIVATELKSYLETSIYFEEDTPQKIEAIKSVLSDFMSYSDYEEYIDSLQLPVYETCTIAVEHLDGTISKVNCCIHNTNLQTESVLQTYTNLIDIEDLISEGDISFLDCKPELTEYSGEAYPSLFSDIDDYMEHLDHTVSNYIWTETDDLFVMSGRSDRWVVNISNTEMFEELRPF